MTEKDEGVLISAHVADVSDAFYHIRFREDGQQFTASFSTAGLKHEKGMMVKTDHGLEPVWIVAVAPPCVWAENPRPASFEIAREMTAEELERYALFIDQEKQAHATCLLLIAKHELEMRLVRVEKFFNGSKMIFYFTADNRVDFRNLVKDLVQEFRARVEMRQVGVRHETKMLGGLGTCGRELCCASFIKKFDSVSIKMAKEQDLPLNPSKISGLCNRLLCCLTYEYDIYRKQRKGMPKVGKKIMIGGKCYMVKRQNPLQESIVVSSEEGEDELLRKEQWQFCKPLKADQPIRKDKKFKE